MPVFMNVWAGSWLICSVCIERMMQMSSAMLPMCGKMIADRLARLGRSWLNVACGPKHSSFLPLQLGDRLALGERLGHRLAVHLGELGLVVERFELRRPAGHAQEDHPLGLLARSAADSRRRGTATCRRRPLASRRQQLRLQQARPAPSSPGRATPGRGTSGGRAAHVEKSNSSCINL